MHPTHPAGKHLWTAADDEAVRRLCESQGPVRVDYAPGRYLTAAVALLLVVIGVLVAVAAAPWSLGMFVAYAVQLVGVALVARVIRVCAR